MKITHIYLCPLVGGKKSEEKPAEALLPRTRILVHGMEFLQLLREWF